MATPRDTARYLIKLAQAEAEPDPLTHLQLQKLLYFVQGWSLAANGQQLFEGTIEAWVHGPVVRELYPEFADYGSDPIPAHHADGSESLTEEERRIIESVWSHYGRYSASELRRLSHETEPWREAREGLDADTPSNRPISNERLRTYFESIAEEHAQAHGFTLESLRNAERELREGRGTRLEDAERNRRDAV